METTLAAQALELLRQRGWIKHASVTQRGFCIGGALAQVCCVDSYDVRKKINVDPITWRALTERADEMIEWVVKEQYPGLYHNYVQFNDDPNTHFADVERVLEKVDVRLQEEMGQ